MPSRFRVREKICKAMQGLSDQIKEHPRSSLGFKHNAQQNFAAWHRAQERKKVIRNMIVMALSLVVMGISWYFKDTMYSYVFNQDGELRKKRRLALMAMIPLMVAVLLASAIYGCSVSHRLMRISDAVKMRHRLEDDEKRSNHPLELSDKAASIWNELSEPTSISPKKPVNEVTETQNEGQFKDGKPNEDKQQQPTGKSSNSASKKSKLNSK